MTLPASYILPLRSEHPRTELAPYLAVLAHHLDVLVVDGSPPDVFRAHEEALSTDVRHLPVDDDLSWANGKVNGVVTGMRHAHHDRLVIADDDVRYDLDGVRAILGALDHADLVVPQNYFEPLPWHARWDTARTLLNRAMGHDYPGTLALRRQVLPGGYDGDVLFENLELVRTVRAVGGRVAHRPDLFVRRIPCSATHFLDQRVRQAYDSLGQPLRFALELMILPVLAGLVRRRGVGGIGWLAATATALAEAGRRRAQGRTVFPVAASAFTPLWLLERGLLIWVALWLRVARGGVAYAGARIRCSAHPERALRRGHIATGAVRRQSPRPGSRSSSPSRLLREDSRSISA